MKKGLHSKPTKVKQCRPNPNRNGEGKNIITCPLFASLLKIGDIPSDYTLRYLINLSDIQLIIAPSFKEAQRVLVALQCLCSELSASAINHELINLIFDA